jgi:peptidoglycan LD-endopeptidase LytH
VTRCHVAVLAVVALATAGPLAAAACSTGDGAAQTASTAVATTPAGGSAATDAIGQPGQGQGTAGTGPTAGGSPAPSRAAARRYVFPVEGRSSYGRSHHDYPATDIITACGLPVLAVTDGVVLEVSRVDRYKPARPLGADKGGLLVSILGDDGVRYYGSHFSAIDNGIQAGVRVSAGTRLGLVGRTGNANNVCHLHFGLSPVCGRTGDWWLRRGVVWPWPYLDAWRAGIAKSPVDEVTAWHRAHGCPPAPQP